MPGLTVSAHVWGDCSGERFVVYSTEKGKSNVWNTFVWSCPTLPSRWGMLISIDWPRLKSCQAVCDECMRGEIYWSLPRDAGCVAMWGWRESRVTKIWGSGHDHGFVLFLFTTMGFHVARSGIFWTQHSCYKGSLLYMDWCYHFLLARCLMPSTKASQTVKQFEIKSIEAKHGFIFILWYQKN